MNGPSAPARNDRPIADIVAEAQRIIGRAEEAELPVRLVGGLAIRLHSEGSIPPSLTRPFKDIDLVTERRSAKKVLALLEALGYEADRSFNGMNAGRRALFYDMTNQRQLDVFIGSFEMCHELPIADRLHLDSATIPLAELLLTKLQIVKLNQKDLLDIYMLMLEHEVGDHDSDTINAHYVAKLCSEDWGLWRTTTMNVERARNGTVTFGLSVEESEIVVSRLDELDTHIEAMPKSRKWKLRDRVGERVRWYQEPEEVSDSE